MYPIQSFRTNTHSLLFDLNIFYYFPTSKRVGPHVLTTLVTCAALPEIYVLSRIKIKFPFKRKACQVYEGGCCRQVSTAVSLVVWWTAGCYCKVVAIDRKVQWYLWQYGRQVDVIEMWLLLTGKYSCVSGSIVDRWVLF